KARARGTSSAAAPSRRGGEQVSTVSTQGNANQIGCVFRPELFHDMGAMHLEGPRLDSELMPALLVGGAIDDEAQYLALTRRQDMLVGTRRRERCISIALCIAAPPPQVDRVAAARDGGFGVHRGLRNAA